MTSKEAVKLARIEFEKDLEYDENNQWLKNIIPVLEQAEKDLEVLKILKKHFQVYFDDETENGLEEKVFNGLDLDDIWGEGYNEDFEKIMEWLENE